MIFVAIVGYSGMLDLGLGRAITAEVARVGNKSGPDSIRLILSHALMILLLLSSLISLSLLVFASQIATIIVGESQPALLEQSRNAIRIIALIVPVVIVSSGIRGALEGQMQFKSINVIMIPMGILMSVVPAALSFKTASLEHLMIGLFAVRLVTMILLARICFDKFGKVYPIIPSLPDVKDLISSGGWMTVSNMISPIMSNMDRIFVSALISPTAAALHVTPYELATKTLLPAGSVANASFPELASQMTDGASTRDRKRYFWNASALTTIVAIVPSILLFIFAKEILTVWISQEFAEGISTSILKIMAVGIVFNAAAFIPFAFIQSVGRSYITARFHMIELALYVPCLMYSLTYFGVVGASIVWVGRVVLDVMLLYSYSLKLMRD